VVTAAASALTVFVWLAEVYRLMEARARPRRLVVIGHRVCALTILGFTGWGLFLFSNGKFGLSDPVVHATEIVEVAAGETDLGLIVPFTWAVLRSWQDPARQERMLLRWDERSRLWAGQPVVVLARRGFFGVTWISAVEPDVERQSRDVLQVVPDAVEVWKERARFNLRIGRFDEARAAADEYVARFPRDPEFPVYVASVLITRERFADVVVLLQPVAERHAHAGALMYLGYALGRQGRRAEGLASLERARVLEPDNWWPYYGLGWVQAAHGDTVGAVQSFERALQLRPGLQDVERELRRLRALATTQRAESAGAGRR